MHKAIVAQIDKVEPIDGADKIQIAYVLGERVIVSKEWKAGLIGVFFPPELQLSEEFCYHNNLFRQAEKNLDKEKSGFFEDTRRVRVQPFLKVKSEGFFATLDCVSYTGHTEFLTIGVQFDALNGKKICEKYISKRTKEANANRNTKKKKETDVPFFSKHFDTDHFKYCLGKIHEGDILSFHAKVHGTSARYAHTQVFMELPWYKKLVNKIVPVFPLFTWEYLCGTRNTILDRPESTGFHGSEGYRFEILNDLIPHLEKGMAIYGEIAGYANGSPIMGKHNTKSLKDKKFTAKYGTDITYTYGCKQTEYRFHVYRITMTNEEGKTFEYSQAQVDKWCKDRGLLPPTMVHPTLVYDGDIEALQKLVYALTERPEVLTECYIDPTHVSEGIIVRVDSGKAQPDFYKSKSYAFRVMEGIAAENEVDLEANVEV